MMHLLLTVSFGGDSQEVIICVNLLLQAIYFYGSLHIVFEFINIAWFICLPWSCSFILDCWQLGVCTYYSFDIATHCHSYGSLVLFAILYGFICSLLVQFSPEISLWQISLFIDYKLFIYYKVFSFISIGPLQKTILVHSLQIIFFYFFTTLDFVLKYVFCIIYLFIMELPVYSGLLATWSMHHLSLFRDRNSLSLL
eukprot:546722_1